MVQNPERRELMLLIGKHLKGSFSQRDEHEMRRLVATEFPAQAAAYGLDDLIRFATGMVAVNYVLKAMGEDVDVEV